MAARCRRGVEVQWGGAVKQRHGGGGQSVWADWSNGMGEMKTCYHFVLI